MSEADSGDTEGPRPEVGRLISQRFAEYVELWAGAAAKFSAGSYRSEDLVDDWFKFYGRATRDMTAGAALLWAASRSGPRSSGGGTTPPQS